MRSLFVLILVGMLAASSPARGYVRSTAPSDGQEPGPCLYWSSRTVPFVLHERGSSDAGVTASLSAARRSFATWSQPACTDLQFLDQGTTARTDVGYLPGSDDNINLVIWREKLCSDVVPPGDPCSQTEDCGNVYNCWEGSRSDPSIALTTTTFDRNTGRIFDADIELNAVGFVFTAFDSPPCPPRSKPSRPSTCVATDVENTLTHEIGHVIGLDHTPVEEATMNATAHQGEISKRTLAQDDVDGLCAIYPRGQPTSVCVSPESEEEPQGCGCASAGSGFSLLALASVLALLRRPGG